MCEREREREKGRKYGSGLGRRERVEVTLWTMEEGLVRTPLAAMSVEGELVEAENDIFYGTFEVLVERPTLLELFAPSTTCLYTPSFIIPFSLR